MQLLAASMLLTAATQLMAAPKVSVEPDRKTALYEMGESASFTIKVTDDGKPVLVVTVRRTPQMPTRVIEEGIAVVPKPDIRWDG